jgi:hypothetical protein
MAEKPKNRELFDETVVFVNKMLEKGFSFDDFLTSVEFVKQSYVRELWLAEEEKSKE